MEVNFISLASGSSGNCYYLGTDEYGILIDAGISVRTIKKRLKQCAGIDLDKVRAVLVTHDHADHIKAVGVLGEKYSIPVYSTPDVHKGINKSYCVKQKLSAASIHYLYKEQPFYIGDFMIVAFEVPHDGTDNVGYCIRIGDKTFTFVTDIGHITPIAANYINKANYLVLEANYDLAMLQTGRYPQYLKQRIYGPKGHMCNDDAAEFLATHYTPVLKYVWLCHLSQDNNRPDIAFQTVSNRLEESGIEVGKDLQLIALNRCIPSELYTFR